MSTYRLDRLLAPRSIAVVGASPRDRSVGRSILRNVLAGGFRGPVQLVNPKYREIDGIAARRQLTDLQAPPDLVIIAAPPSAVPEIVSQAGAQGCAAAIIVTSGLGHGPGSVAEAAQESARRFGLRLVGPNCLGVLVPRAMQLQPVWRNGARSTTWDFPQPCRWAIRLTSILGTSSTILPSTRAPGRYCFTLRRSTMALLAHAGRL
jgi:acyl-CoA synthetase (NDP forming)